MQQVNYSVLYNVHMVDDLIYPMCIVEQLDQLGLSRADKIQLERVVYDGLYQLAYQGKTELLEQEFIQQFGSLNKAVQTHIQYVKGAVLTA